MRAPFAETVRRIAFQGSLVARPCGHVAEARALEPARSTCQACGPDGQRAVKLRMCLTCGSVGCCDSSPQQHARGHFEATGHPLMRSIEPGESWAWCYPDQAYAASAEMQT
jgi:CPA1 family monovalent cation:H+ antiporter